MFGNDTVKIPTKLLKNKSEGVAPNWLKNLLRDSIIHEDNHVIVVDKPFGVPSHSGSKLNLELSKPSDKLNRMKSGLI